MAVLSPLVAALAGIVPSYASAAGGGDTFANSGRQMLHVKNGSGSSINVTISGQTACNHGTVHDQVVAVAAGAEKMIGPFDPTRFNDSTTGRVSVAYSSATTVTVAVVTLGA